ncbi:hypothetical protein [Cellulophaga baltica]|uniref:hypothetical protein n=1 Tax=Cellulophaga baltica TaxID=76594 RepID=UPI0003FDB43C|nr:hypothetical protein [Cellulophaga baltica]
MEKYNDLSGNSNISAFEIGNDYIRVCFRGTSKIYTYSNRNAGKRHVDNMKILARKGSGLNGYINSNVKFSYD